MKSKKGTYILLTAVIIIWGIIVWRVFFFSRHDKQVIGESLSTAIIEEQAEKPRMALDYPDPFLKNSRTEATPTIPSSRKEAIGQPVNMRYIGLIEYGNTSFYLINIDNQSFTLKIGESAGDYLLSRADRDSLYFLHNEQILRLKIEK